MATINRTSKTVPAYIDDRGVTRSITRKGRMWYVDYGHGFSHMDMVRAWLEEQGYTYTRVPNRNYRPRLRHFEELIGRFGLS